MSVDIDKKPLTILSNEVADVEKDENNFDVIVPLVIDKNNWATVSQYLYTNLLCPRYKRDYDPLTRQIGYFEAYDKLYNKCLLDVTKHALSSAYENLIYSNKDMAERLIKSEMSRLVYSDAYLPKILTGGSELIGDVLMDIRKYITQETAIRREKEKEEEMIPLLYNTYTAFLYLKDRMLEKSLDIKEYEGKTPSEILALASNDFKRPPYDIAKRVYRQISIPSSIIEEIKSDPKKLDTYRYYLSTVLHPTVLKELEGVDFTKSDQSIERILCSPIPIEVIKVFLGDNRNIVPVVRKMYIRKGYNIQSVNLNRQKLLAVISHVISLKNPDYSEDRKQKLADMVMGKLNDLGITSYFEQLRKTKNKSILDLLNSIKLEKSTIEEKDIEEAEKFALDPQIQNLPKSDDEVLLKVLEDARKKLGVDRPKYEKEDDIVYISNNSEFSPYNKSSTKNISINDMIFPTVTHYVIYKLVGALPNVTNEELAMFYRSVILCGGDKGQNSRFITIERLIEIYNEISISMNENAKTFYLEKALNVKFLPFEDVETVAINSVPKSISEVAHTGDMKIFSSNTDDLFVSKFTANWLNKNKNAIISQLDKTKSERFDINKVPLYPSLYMWVTSNMKDFMNAVLRVVNYFGEFKKTDNSSDILNFVKAFAYLVYYKETSYLAYEDGELNTVEPPPRIKYMFNGKYEPLLPAMEFIYRAALSPLYVLGVKLGYNVLEMDNKINSATRYISNPKILCLPDGIVKSDEEIYNNKLKNRHKCILTSIISVLKSLQDMAKLYDYDMKVGPEEVKLALSLIINLNVNIKMEKPTDEKLIEILNSVLGTNFGSSLTEKSLSAVYGATLSVDNVKIGPDVKQNRAVYFTAKINKNEV